ncbi:hypothetical protein LDL08_40430 [Nonomuraea glycinis]|uniref:DUF3800 domain-containing protein n=1 Tax=Nonomuraea glycinis TaxID=2047744 RepID=A0A918E944_9ACTN|nr:hypothetical protein [Nonomuraea glycinis]MCA2182445.1 hypothetical protein [Nonomuraea glycinis]GGP16202.1 hypothetical protein GCM10012278_79040 [Nonomuraea glycinis]
MNPPFSAYVDESMLLTQGLYLMAAVFVGPIHADACRHDLRALLLRRQKRLHWRDENDKRRAQLIEAVAALRPTGIVVVGAGLDPKRQERARRKCMEHLLWEMGGHHVHDVIFERRHSELDLRDHELVAVLQGRHSMPPKLRLSWRDPLTEPLLWLPDIIAGALSRAERGDCRFWSQVNADLLVRRIDAR